MSKYLKIIFSIFVLLLTINCKKENTNEKITNNQVVTDSSVVVNESSKDEENYYNVEESQQNNVYFKLVDRRDNSITVTYSDGTPIKFDDEVDYSNFPLLKMFCIANMWNYDLYTFQGFYYDKTGKSSKDVRPDSPFTFHTEEFKDFVNSKLNLINEVPLKTTEDKIDKIFNRLYYDYKDSEVYPKERGYGYQKFIVRKYGSDSEQQFSIKRDEKSGNMTVTVW